MNPRILPNETHTAAMNMALDEACMQAVRDGNAPLTIRLYRWNPAAVSIGYFQCLKDEVDLDEIRKAGIDIVRRQTGGGAVYHDHEITYSIIGPEEEFSEDIQESYQEILSCVIEGLAEVGIKAEYRPINDLLSGGKKISGNAQTRKAGALLQHGTILLHVEPEKMFTFLTPDKSKLSDKPYIKSVKSAVTSVAELTQATREEVEAAIRRAFVKKYDASPGSWSRDELDTAAKLVTEKYASETWNAMR